MNACPESRLSSNMHFVLLYPTQTPVYGWKASLEICCGHWREWGQEVEEHRLINGCRTLKGTQTHLCTIHSLHVTVLMCLTHNLKHAVLLYTFAKSVTDNRTHTHMRTHTRAHTVLSMPTHIRMEIENWIWQSFSEHTHIRRLKSVCGQWQACCSTLGWCERKGECSKIQWKLTSLPIVTVFQKPNCPKKPICLSIYL